MSSVSEPHPEQTLALRKKVVVVGDGYCGKTSLLNAFSKDQFLEDYIPTVCETFVKEVQVDGRTVELVLWDTAGQEEYSRLRSVAYSGCQAVIVCFAVDDPTSCQNVGLKWCPEARHFCPGVPIVLAATKLDLRRCPQEEALPTTDGRGRSGNDPATVTVTDREGRRMAERVASSAYVECSAKTRAGVRSVFEATAREVLKSEATERKQQKNCVIY